MTSLRPTLTVVGRRLDPEHHRLRDFLTRIAQPFEWVEAGADAAAGAASGTLGSFGGRFFAARRSFASWRSSRMSAIAISLSEADLASAPRLTVCNIADVPATAAAPRTTAIKSPCLRFTWMPPFR